jgi:hypothetical protein
MGVVIEYIVCYFSAFALGFASAIGLVLYVKHKSSSKSKPYDYF